MNKTKKIALAAFITAILPVVAFAQVATSPNPPSIGTLNISALGEKIVGYVWIIFTVIAVIMFVIAGIMFLTSAGDPEKIQKARQAFLWGVAGIVVGVLAYGIVTLVTNALQ